VLWISSPVVSVLSLVFNMIKPNEIEGVVGFLIKSAVIVLNVCTMLVVNTIVYLILRSQRKKISNQVTDTEASSRECRIRTFKKEVRVLYTVFGCSISTILIFLSSTVVRVFSSSTKPEEIMVITSLNPIVDAFFFLWFCKDVRSSFTKLLKTLKDKIVSYTVNSTFIIG